MPYKTYYATLASQETYADKFFPDLDEMYADYTEEELELAQFSWCFYDIYVPEEGDKLLFFGETDTNGNYRITNVYQGCFVLEDGSWKNQSIYVDVNDWQEPLAVGLLMLSGTTIVDNDVERTFEIDGYTYTQSYTDCDTEIAIPENTLLTAVEEVMI